MSYKITNNQLTFAKKSKPRSLSGAQRDVREVYLVMCELGLPRSEQAARMMFINEVMKMSQDQVLTLSPTYDHSIRSAARAYAGAGDSLKKFKTMYSMDFTIPVKDLDKLTDLDKDLVAALRASGQAEITVKAREL